MGDWQSGYYIASQVFVFFAYAAFAYTYFVKTRIVVLSVTMVGNVCYGISYGFLAAWTGLLLVGVALARDITSACLEHRRTPADKNHITKTDCALLVVWVGAAVAITYFTWAGVASIFALLGMLAFTVSIWQKNKVVYNFLGIGVCVSWIIYNVFIESLLGVILESIFLAAVTIGAILSVCKRKLDNQPNPA